MADFGCGQVGNASQPCEKKIWWKGEIGAVVLGVKVGIEPSGAGCVSSGRVGFIYKVES